MKKVKITVVKIANHQDLIDKYELPLKLPCSMKVGDVYLCEGHVMPKNFCEHAWESLSPCLFESSRDIFLSRNDF